MKLAEKHKQFVVKRFARFMKVPDIVEEFMEDFEDELYGIFDESTSNTATTCQTVYLASAG